MPEIMTTAGPVSAEDLGPTLPHEHVFINEVREMRTIGLLNDRMMMTGALEDFRAAGGRTIVELTTTELTHGAAPDPAGYLTDDSDTGYAESGTRAPGHVRALRDIAEATGVQLVLGTGHYRDPYLEDGWLDRHSTKQVAARMIADITTGFPGTDVRAGIIGEIGCDKWYISALEERSFRAAAMAHLATGLTITTHAARWPVGIAQLDLLAEHGVDPRRVIVGHCDGVNLPDYHLELARRGVFVEFDTIRGTTTYDTELRVGFVLDLRAGGYLDRILLSHDVCEKPQLRTHGGHGYTFVLQEFLELLRQRGLSKEETERLTIDNPRRALTGET